MAYGKTIRLFLIDGETNGKQYCELSNWVGKVYKIPRNEISSNCKITDFNSTGVYFLLGNDEEKNRKSIYIGEAENIFDRIKHHLMNKNWWTECIFVVSKDNNLNKAHIKYMEHMLYKSAVDSKQYTIMNESIPSKSSVSDADEAELDEFMDNTKILVNTLGYKAFEPLITEKELEDTESTLYIKTKNATASGKRTSEGFVVIKGSTINPTVAASMPKGYKELRIKYAEFIDSGNSLTENILFASPSAAATFVLGGSSNGVLKWKNKDGKTLKQIETIE